MSSKKSKIINIVKNILIAGLAMAVIFLSLIVSGFFDVPDTDGQYRGTLQVYNEGCCFILKELDVQLVYEDGTTQRVLYVLEPYYQLKQSTILSPLDIEGSIEVVVSFYFEYINSGHVSFSVMRFNDAAQLKTDGIILYFGDGVLHVKSGGREAVFSDGQSPWVTGLKSINSESASSPHAQSRYPRYFFCEAALDSRIYSPSIRVEKRFADDGNVGVANM